MPEFYYRTSESIRGPWLIDSAELRSLDAILDDEYARLVERNEEDLKSEVDERLNHVLQRKTRLSDDEIGTERREIEQSLRQYYTGKRELVIFYDKGKKKAKTATFEEAMRESTLVGEVPVGFELDLECGAIRCNIELSKYSDASLSIRVSPEHVSEARELFVSVLRWSKGSRPPRWQQIWKSANGLQWIALFMVLMIGAIAIGNSAETEYKEQARVLLANGVRPDNQLKALEILLALQTDYEPPGREMKIPSWLKMLFFGGLLVCLASSFAPKAILGIGGGEDKIKFWRLWLRFVFYLVPTFILINVVWPIIHDRILGFVALN